jgi:hypothetical protein
MTGLLAMRQRCDLMAPLIAKQCTFKGSANEESFA